MSGQGQDSDTWHGIDTVVAYVTMAIDGRSCRVIGRLDAGGRHVSCPVEDNDAVELRTRWPIVIIYGIFAEDDYNCGSWN